MKGESHDTRRSEPEIALWAAPVPAWEGKGWERLAGRHAFSYQLANIILGAFVLSRRGRNLHLGRACLRWRWLPELSYIVTRMLGLGPNARHSAVPGGACLRVVFSAENET